MAKTATKKAAPKKKVAAKPVKKAVAKPVKKAAAKPVKKVAAPKKKAAARTPNAAFMKPVTPSETLAAVVGPKPVPRTEITRFPHAVLEVKLSLPEGQSAPEWVTDLIESGFLTEVGDKREEEGKGRQGRRRARAAPPARPLAALLLEPPLRARQLARAGGLPLLRRRQPRARMRAARV